MSSSDRHLLLRDVRTIELAFEAHVFRSGVRTVARFRDGVAARDHVHHPTASHEDVAAWTAFGRSVEREHVLGQAIEALDGHSDLRRPRIVLGTEHDVHVRTFAEADRLRGNVLGQVAFTESEQQLREVAFDPRKRDLGLRIAEACVVLEHSPTVRGLHEARIEDAAVRRPAFRERLRDRRDQLFAGGLARASTASSSVRAMVTPLPSASPSAFTTTGTSQCRSPSFAAAASAKDSDLAVGTPASAMSSFANDFDHSIFDASRDAPTTEIPERRRTSPIPAATSSSVPTIARSMNDARTCSSSHATLSGR